MLKADAALFNDLTSSDDAVRIKAATKLEQRPIDHFKDHPVGWKFIYEPAQIQSLLDGWESTRSNLVKAWIAQALQMTQSESLKALLVRGADYFNPDTSNRLGAVLSLMVDSLKLDGPYMDWVAQTVYELHRLIPNGDDILRGLVDHPNSKVRWRCAVALSFFAFCKQLTADDPILLRRLMLDTDATVRNKAVYTAKEFPGLGPEDYEILLDVEKIDSYSARALARELMAKLEATVPGCRREAFAPREPLLRTEGVYYAGRAELDAAGQWITNACLRFLPDGTAHAFSTGDPPVTFPKRLPREQEHVASGTFVKDGACVTFSCTGKGGSWRYEGHIDGDKLHLSSVHAESRRRIEEVYRWMWTPLKWTPLNWNTTPAPEPVAKKGALPFIPLKPRSVTCAEARQWYRQMVAWLPLLLEAEATPADSRLAVAWETKRQLRDTAARALGDPVLKKEFLDTLPLPPLDELKALHGDAVLQGLFEIT